MQWLQSVFSEPDGSGSSSRVLTGAIVFTILGLIVFLTLVHKQLPDLPTCGEFIALTSAALYGTNKISTTFLSRRQPPETAPGAQSAVDAPK